MTGFGIFFWKSFLPFTNITLIVSILVIIVLLILGAFFNKNEDVVYHLWNIATIAIIVCVPSLILTLVSIGVMEKKIENADKNYKKIAVVKLYAFNDNVATSSSVCGKFIMGSGTVSESGDGRMYYFYTVYDKQTDMYQVKKERNASNVFIKEDTGIPRLEVYKQYVTDNYIQKYIMKQYNKWKHDTNPFKRKKVFFIPKNSVILNSYTLDLK